MANACCEIQWITYLMRDLKFDVQLPISLRCDNQATISIGKNHVSHNRIKHVEIDCLMVKDLVDNRTITTPYTHTTDQLADLFTKGKSFKHMLPCLEKMGLKHIKDVSV